MDQRRKSNFHRAGKSVESTMETENMSLKHTGKVQRK